MMETKASNIEKVYTDKTRYVKRQIIVHAFQWDGAEDLSPLKKWMEALGDQFDLFFEDDGSVWWMKDPIYNGYHLTHQLARKDGVHQVARSTISPLPGEYIVRDVNGAYMIYNETSFENTFRKF